MRTGYSVPFVNPPITSGLATDAGERVTHVDPSVEYSTLLAVAPLSQPCAKNTDSEPLPEFTAAIVGACGAPAGRPGVDALGVPGPCTFTARTRTT